MSNSPRKVLEVCSGICILDFQKQSVGVALKVLGKSLKTVLDEGRFVVNLYSFPLLPGPLDKPFLSQGKSFTPSKAEQLPKLPPSLDTSTIASVCIFSSNLSHS